MADTTTTNTANTIRRLTLDLHAAEARAAAAEDRACREYDAASAWKREAEESKDEVSRKETVLLQTKSDVKSLHAQLELAAAALARADRHNADLRALLATEKQEKHVLMQMIPKHGQ